MLRIVLLSLGAALLFAPAAEAHEGHGARCAYGNTHSGYFHHYHPGGYAPAVPCGGGGGGGYGPPMRGGGGYYEAPPPPPPTYYGDDDGYYGGGGGYYRRGYGGGRPGDYGPQTNRAQDCYNIGGNRVCCPKGWTVQGGTCKPYRGY